jgi:hypothetical protein
MQPSRHKTVSRGLWNAGSESIIVPADPTSKRAVSLDRTQVNINLYDGFAGVGQNEVKCPGDPPLIGITDHLHHIQ